MGLFVINTAGSEVVLTYGRDDITCKHKFYPHDRDFSEKLAGMMNDTLCGVEPPSEAIAVCTGPGGYTSLRIAITAAKMLALSFSIPLIEIRSSDIYANSADFSSSKFFLVALETNRPLIFLERFCAQSKKSLEKPTMVTAEEIANTLENNDCMLAGNATTRLRKLYPDIETSNKVVHTTSILLGQSQYNLSRRYYQQKLWAKDPDSVKPLYFGTLNL